ncbi:MAG: hypothetical protein M3540_03945 [Actinomycetota bacterium]|nr:hypothetical protein [Actinomycetota bacterium]
MSEPEQQIEQRSSVKIGMNAKGEAQVEVKVYVDEDPQKLEEARQLAIRAYNDTARTVRG